MDGFVQLLAELQSLPNFPPRLSLAAPLGLRSPLPPLFTSRCRQVRGASGKRWLDAPIQHANIVAALCSRRAKNGDESRKMLLFQTLEGIPGERDVSFSSRLSRSLPAQRTRSAPQKYLIRRSVSQNPNIFAGQRGCACVFRLEEAQVSSSRNRRRRARTAAYSEPVPSDLPRNHNRTERLEFIEVDVLRPWERTTHAFILPADPPSCAKY